MRHGYGRVDGSAYVGDRWMVLGFMALLCFLVFFFAWILCKMLMLKCVWGYYIKDE